MSELLMFFTEHYIIGILALIAVLEFSLKIVFQLIIMITIAIHGWPPDHFDISGNLKIKKVIDSKPEKI